MSFQTLSMFIVALAFFVDLLIDPEASHHGLRRRHATSKAPNPTPPEAK